ncbi:PTS sugar transporter subunit IIA [Desulfobotulus sp.]|jgi:PTS system nitrogen regulatory IIA component|uniref:PTS sugar transporter subunit IIA n=1 Tax=Desulfobotulus sp. TaxID=1940337 RepID=UPI002A36ADB1|nr:PTS sugar transporter subunit IIA [Desulfobotulus sp.]MDY0164748.1 PTS sugar transporter subunit IIA [Desulfobotulus sp.]
MMKRLSLQEMAASLELPVYTLERWIRQGRIPIVRAENLCVFREENLSRWARQHHIPFRMREEVSSPLPFCDDSLEAAFRRGRFMQGLEGENAVDLLGRMAGAVPGISRDQEAQLLEKLLEREALGSTGVGRGIALPHPRTPLPGFPEKSCIITAFPVKPVAYASLDGQPVFVFFMLLSPDVKAHLSLLSRLSFCLRDPDFYAGISRNPENEVLIGAVRELEKNMMGRSESP